MQDSVNVNPTLNRHAQQRSSTWAASATMSASQLLSKHTSRPGEEECSAGAPHNLGGVAKGVQPDHPAPALSQRVQALAQEGAACRCMSAAEPGDSRQLSHAAKTMQALPHLDSFTAMLVLLHPARVCRTLSTAAMPACGGAEALDAASSHTMPAEAEPAASTN